MARRIRPIRPIKKLLLSPRGRAVAGGSGKVPVIILSGFSLPENSAQGTAVGNLSVLFGSGTYTFTLTDSAGSRFQVAGTNGVNLQGGATSSNAEAAPSYNVTIRADNGAGSIITRTVAIAIVDVNEFTPVITSNGGGPTANISISENTSAVTIVAATDADAAASLVYSISGGADAARFTINQTSGALSFVSPPNFEAPTDADTNNIYVVIVRASDGTNFVTQTINVTVTDVNEFAPVITSNGGGTSASVSVAENSNAVTTVTATDADGTASISYSIVGGVDAASFTINSSSGELAFAVAPDFETPTDANGDNVYVVVVRASDGSNASDQTISVTVTDVVEGGAGSAGEMLGFFFPVTKAGGGTAGEMLGFPFPITKAA